MYQAQQEAELGELQNQENVKTTLPISQIATLLSAWRY